VVDPPRSLRKLTVSAVRDLLDQALDKYTHAMGRRLWHHRRLRGQPTRFLTGTDDNALKNVAAARAAGVDVRTFVDDNAARFAALRDPLALSFDDFIRTSVDPRHAAGVARLWRECAATGDFYRRRYEGLYCAGCEQFYRAARVDAVVHAPAALILEQPRTRIDRLPAILLKELGDQAPPNRVVSAGQQRSEPRDSHGLVHLGPLLHYQDVSTPERRAGRLPRAAVDCAEGETGIGGLHRT
jgi:hypothetical protein